MPTRKPPNGIGAATTVANNVRNTFIGQPIPAPRVDGVSTDGGGFCVRSGRVLV